MAYLKEILKSANEGDANAQFEYASILSSSRFLTASKKAKIFKYYMMSAEQGNVRAEYEVGRCYMLGVGVEFNESSAQYWFSKSMEGIKNGAEKEDATYQYILAYSYEKGLGVETDYGKACFWYKKSSSNGNVFAEAKLKKLLNGVLSVDETQLKTLAESGNPDAEYKYAMSLKSKNGPSEEDLKTAFKFLYDSAQKGNRESVYETAICYLMGEGTEENHFLAVEYLKRASDLNFKPAKKLLKKITGESVSE